MSDTSDAGGAAPTDAPTEPGPAPAPARPRFRWTWRRIVVVIAVLLVGGTAVWWRGVVTSDPKLEFTFFNGVNRVEHDATGNPEGITRTENRLGTQIDIAFVPNQKIFVYLGLRNGGGQAVRIEKVPVTGFYYFGFDGMDVSPNRNISVGEATTYDPFKPFTLKSGEERNVRLTFRLADCSPSGLQPGHTTIRGLLVRYKILGLGRTGFAPFTKSVLSVPTIGRCEHPIIDPAGGPVRG